MITTRAADTPPLPPGALHVWSADLDSWGVDRASSPREEFECGTLSREELERGHRILRAQAARRWMAGRAFLRALLALYLDADPSSLRLACDERGKPELLGVGGGGLRFNLSHSGSLAVCALARGCAVGVDVQLRPRHLDVRGVAQRVFGGGEAQRLCALPEPQGERELLRAWVMLEAERKRVGLGIACLSERSSGPTPWVEQLDVGPGGAGAVALGFPPSELRCARWCEGGTPVG